MSVGMQSWIWLWKMMFHPILSITEPATIRPTEEKRSLEF